MSDICPTLPESQMRWFREDKFGMFIHWGLYALLGRGEWVMFKERIDIDEYAKLTEKFDASNYDPVAWAKLAKDAGMKYMVLTARHHDGFSLFKTDTDDYNSMNSAAGRDLVAEFVTACRDAGLKVGLYYSPMDWRFPGYFFPKMFKASAQKMKEQCWEQIRELMTNYGKIDMLWYDGEWLAHGGIAYQPGGKGWYRDGFTLDDAFEFWESDKLNAMVRSLQPEIMINNRSAWEGDFDVRERYIGELHTKKPWDTNDCLCDSWGYIPDSEMRSLRNCIRFLVEVIGRDGNLLLNVGPDGTGHIEQRKIDRLKQVGQWLEQFGHTIYGTRGGPFTPGSWGASTHKDNKIYLHIIDWPEDRLKLGGFSQKVVSAENLTGGAVDFAQTDAGYEISVPGADRNANDTIIALTLASDVDWQGSDSDYTEEYGKGDGLAE